MAAKHIKENKMQKRSGTYHRLYYHFVWSTKERLAMLEPDIEDAIKKVFYSKARDIEIRILEANGTTDHVHVLVESKPPLSPTDIARHLKGSSSHFVNHVILNDDKTRQLYWQDGYGVESVSPQAVKSVQQYIRKQKEHHANGCAKEELETESVD
jgi:putative transposase